MYTVIADTDAIITRIHWDSFLRRTLEKHCMAGINPRPALGAVEWNWIAYKSAVHRGSALVTDADSIVTQAYAIPGFKDWGEWWEMRAKLGGW